MTEPAPGSPTESSPDRPDETLDQVAKLYSDGLAEHGATSKSVGWKDPDQQILRFDKLCESLLPEGPDEAFTVNDWGCGYGAMFGYLDERWGEKLETYNGFDIAKSMLGHLVERPGTITSCDPSTRWPSRAASASRSIC